MVPETTTTNVNVASRGTRLYLDPNQNDFADTVASAYSVRPFREPTVSTPLNWSEIKSSLKADAFTIHTIMKRVESKGDLFARVFDKKVAEKNNHVLRKFI